MLKHPASCQRLAGVPRSCMACPANHCSRLRRPFRGTVRFSSKDGIQRVIESSLEHKDKVEIVMMLAQAEVQAKLAKAEMQAKLAEAEVQAKLAQEKEVSWQLKLNLERMKLGARTAELMQMRGKLHMRGLIGKAHHFIISHLPGFAAIACL